MFAPPFRSNPSLRSSTASSRNGAQEERKGPHPTRHVPSTGENRYGLKTEARGVARKEVTSVVAPAKPVVGLNSQKRTALADLTGVKTEPAAKRVKADVKGKQKEQVVPPKTGVAAAVRTVREKEKAAQSGRIKLTGTSAGARNAAAIRGRPSTSRIPTLKPYESPAPPLRSALTTTRVAPVSVKEPITTSHNVSNRAPYSITTSSASLTGKTAARHLPVHSIHQSSQKHQSTQKKVQPLPIARPAAPEPPELEDGTSMDIDISVSFSNDDIYLPSTSHSYIRPSPTTAQLIRPAPKLTRNVSDPMPPPAAVHQPPVMYRRHLSEVTTEEHQAHRKAEHHAVHTGLLPKVGKGEVATGGGRAMARDVLMEDEYAEDIVMHLRQMELQTMPNPTYMTHQPNLTWHMRTILVDWLIRSHALYAMKPETLYLTINLIDRFLSIRQISLEKYQLVGVTALFIAAKYEEIVVPTVGALVYIVAGAYNADEILAAERYMLGLLKWEIGSPGPLGFMRRISLAEGGEGRTRVMAKFFLEVCLLEEGFLRWGWSFCASGAMWVSRKIIFDGEWTEAHVRYSGYKQEEIMECAWMMCDCAARLPKDSAVYEKYAGEKFMFAAPYVQEYIKRWGFVGGSSGAAVVQQGGVEEL
ncbi:hypothetical protein HK097_008504 [Rhizophlyctis rosea]|uniref:Cyclin N-terminal domain-containing protein n=1 Tax=Rhizophlyctis rosea TaxID=64517 RepID=A0AAD5X3X6_9FUNG|nr:hypothetical protein HK097_008504 [Rhizophlyctis rosea]